MPLFLFFNRWIITDKLSLTFYDVTMHNKFIMSNTKNLPKNVNKKEKNMRITIYPNQNSHYVVKQSIPGNNVKNIEKKGAKPLSSISFNIFSVV